MALQVWLPLNGNLNNQGLMNVSVINNNATVNNNGKIGKCYYFNGSSYLSASMDYSGFHNQFSVAFWFNLPSAPASNVELINFGPTAGWAVIYYGVVVGSNLTLSSSVSNGSSYIATGFNTTITTGKWYHYAFTFNNGVMNLYIDGTFVKTMTTSIVPALTNSTKIGIGAAPNGQEKSTSYINDVRIYDHVLSDKEVHEISKGLILHYKLDDRFIEPTKNLVVGITAGGQTTVNGLSVTTSGNNSDTYFKLNLSEALISGETYTLSCYAENVPYGKRWGFPVGAQSNTSVLFNIYNGYNSLTFTANSVIANCGTSLMMDDNARGDVYMNRCIFRDFQIEKKDHATGYINGERTASSIVVSDCSGYGNDGAISGAIVVDYDTARYGTCCNYLNSDGSISIGNLSTICPGGIFTFNIWFKKKTGEWSSKSWETILGGPIGFELEGKLGSSTNAYVHPYSWGGGSTSTPNSYSIQYSLNQWNMLTMVSTPSNTTFYLNGELKVTGNARAIPSGNYYIGSWKDAVSQNYRGRLSDARIYVTALSASDILELYNVGQSIDNHGNVYAYEFKE